jgi:hypothetical protein
MRNSFASVTAMNKQIPPASLRSRVGMTTRRLGMTGRNGSVIKEKASKRDDAAGQSERKSL